MPETPNPVRDPTWYHLSVCAAHTRVASAKGAAEVDAAVLSPRPPVHSYGESQTPRICVAPTVWQCVLGVPAENSPTMTIYELRPRLHLPAADATVGDAGDTHEAWITDAFIAAHRTPIPLAAIGRVRITPQTQLALKIAHKRKLTTASRDECDVLWSVLDAVWELRPEFLHR